MQIYRRRTMLMKCVWATSIVVLGTAVGAAAVYRSFGSYGLQALMRRGGTTWREVRADDPWLPLSMREGLAEHRNIEPAPFEYRTLTDGLDVAEVPVFVDGVELDRILLTRVESRRFRLVCRSDPSGSRELGDWMEQLRAVLVINGSYYAPDGAPATPFVSDGVQLGPLTYDAQHGALVVRDGIAHVHDLAGDDWTRAFRGAQFALVSYPLLVDSKGESRVQADRRWLANRSFVAEDGSGRIVLGTTTTGFFSLERLAQFLRAPSLGLSVALNLDGGPVACQGVRYGTYRREFCGEYEMAADSRTLRVLQPRIPGGKWALPVVIAAQPLEADRASLP